MELKTYEPKLFKEKYKEFLIAMENKEERSCNQSQGFYIELDSVRDVKRTTFYYDLTCFLNHQEKNVGGEDTYLFLPPRETLRSDQKKEYEKYNDNMDAKKIAVLLNDADKEEEKLFYLTSDQFGFSAAECIYKKPFESNKYPLARLFYGSKKSDEDEVKDLIVQYVENTRTIGGSFLWPISSSSRNCMYNLQRGIKSYLEDRVDLTLWEIKHALDKNYDRDEHTSDILYKQYRTDTKMKNWLKHFGTFEKYVEYFVLDDFVKDDVPINITNGEPLNEEDIKECKEQYKKGRLQELSMEELKKMLRRLEEMIRKRSEKIEASIKSNSSICD